MIPDRPQKRGIALCLTYYLPNVSGLTLSTHSLARYLAGQGHPVTIVAGRYPAKTPQCEVAEDIKVVRSWAPLRLGKALLMPFYVIDLWRALDDVAVVNVHLPNLDAAAVSIVAKLRQKTLIVSYACSMSDRGLANKAMRAVAAIPHMVAGLLADTIQTVSADYAAQSVFCRLFRAKLTPAPPPLGLPLLSGETHGPRAPRQPSAERPFRVGYVGRIAEQKSLGVLLDALPQIAAAIGPHFVIELAGPTADVVGERHWRDILKRTQSMGDKVVYHGVLHGAALADYYAELDVLALPSTDRLESFGLVQVEAMLRGVPVVASDLPGMRMPIRQTGMGRLFKPGDSAALASALADILRNGPPSVVPPQDLLTMFGDEVACRPYVEALS